VIEYATMLKLINVSLGHGANTLIDNVNLSVFEKNRLGLVGSNGCGKTTLFHAILGELHTQKGEIECKKNARIVCLEQETPGVELSALDYVISGDKPLFEILQGLKEAERTEDFDGIMNAHTNLHEMDGYSAEARAGKILNGLGFDTASQQKTVKEFSGGWRMRLNLAKCLFAPSDLLLLDEPTNHLDMETIIWLEGFLRTYPGAILMVSHDQDFLDRAVTHIAHIENKTLKLYTGNYSSFEKQHAEHLAQAYAQNKKHEAARAHLMKFVERFRAKASKAKQAQSRLKAIEKMGDVLQIYEESPFHFQFLEPEKMPATLITMSKVDLGYNGVPIIKKANLSLLAGQRIGLLGINGAGKSTCIKGLCGELPPLSGMLERSKQLVVGYFAQHQVDHLNMASSPLQLLKDLNCRRTEKELISYLAGFGFDRDQSLSPIQNFSGGEKSRVALALIIWQKPNLLLLDEPTNHLDLQVRQALTLALQDFEGTMILVSHDRHLLRSLVDELYLIDNGKFERFNGTVEDYQAIYA
jgi:ATP-binding cassette subfamily F protein 3